MIPSGRLRLLLAKLNVPAALLVTLLQRTPVLRVVTMAEEEAGFSPLGSVVRSAFAVAASLGAVHTLVGASGSIVGYPSNTLNTTVGTPTAAVFSVPNAQLISSWVIVNTGNQPSTFPPGLTFSGGGSSPAIQGPGIINVPNQTAQLTGTPTTTGVYVLYLQAWNGANATGTYSTSGTYVIYVNPGSATIPSFTQNPVSVNVAAGRSAVLSAVASGTPMPTCQWKLNGTAISGATSAVLLVSGATSANAGSYTCVATNSAGSKTSTAATLTVTTTSNPGRLTNLSARADVGTGAGILITGFGIAGSGTKNLLLRGVGPGMYNTFQVPTYLPSVQLAFYDGENPAKLIASNTGWVNSPVAGNSPVQAVVGKATPTLMSTLGAFPYATGSLDAALAATVPTGSFTSQVIGQGSSPTGVSLAEIYDADVGTPSATLVNLSARVQVGTGFNILVGGFTIAGSTDDTILIRADGPGLTSTFGLTGVLSTPQLILYDGANPAQVIATETSWGGNPTLGTSSVAASVGPASAAVMGTVGAFSLATGSTDSAILVTLPPGGYTAQVSGADTGSGIALVEIYEVP